MQVAPEGGFGMGDSDDRIVELIELLQYQTDKLSNELDAVAAEVARGTSNIVEAVSSIRAEVSRIGEKIC